jgi:hypothetical protein
MDLLFNNLTFLIIQSLVEYGGLSEGDIARKLIYFGAYRVTIFHGVKSGVTTQLMHKTCSICEQCQLHASLHQLGCSKLEHVEFGF